MVHSLRQIPPQPNFSLPKLFVEMAASSQHPLAGTPRRNVSAILFDLDGTLLDTESLSDVAMLQALKVQGGLLQRLNGKLPWELKSRILGMRGSEWSPIVIHYFRSTFGLGDGTPGNEELSPSKLWGDWEEVSAYLCLSLRSFCLSLRSFCLSLRSFPLLIFSSPFTEPYRAL